MSRGSILAVASLVVVAAVAAPGAALAQRGEGRPGGGEVAGQILNEVFSGLQGAFGGMNQGGGANPSDDYYPSNGFPSNGYPSNGYPPNGYYPSNNFGDSNAYAPNNFAPDPYPNTAPAPQPAPAKPKANELPKIKKIKPVKNIVKGLKAHPVSRADIRNWHDQASQKIDDDIAVLDARLPNNATQTIILNNTGMSPADVDRAKDLIAKGDEAGLQKLLTDNKVPAANADSLLKIAAAKAALAQLKNNAQQGAATNADLAAAYHALQGFVGPAGDKQADAALNDIMASSHFIDALDQAVPGNHPLPTVAPLIFVVSGLPQGQVYPLGNGAVLTGGSLSDVGIGVARGTIASAAGLSVGAGRPLPSSSNDTPTSGALLTNDASAEVNYTVNGRHYTLQPDYTQTLPAGNAWTVSFDKGGAAGLARYSLSSGTYSFAANESGWELYKKTYRTTIDNTKNPQPFNYVSGGKQKTLEAGEEETLSSSYPIVVSFDNGAGQVVRRRLDSGEVNVALTPDGKSIDLYAATEIPQTDLEDDENAAEPDDASAGPLRLFGAGTGSGGARLFDRRSSGGGAN